MRSCSLLTIYYSLFISYQPHLVVLVLRQRHRRHRDVRLEHLVPEELRQLALVGDRHLPQRLAVTSTLKKNRSRWAAPPTALLSHYIIANNGSSRLYMLMSSIYFSTLLLNQVQY